jgi:hypothetical protein
MANVVGVVNDVFDLLSESSLKKEELVAVMTELLVIFEENMVIEGYADELEDCLGIDNRLDAAIEKYYADMEGDDDEDEELEEVD